MSDPKQQSGKRKVYGARRPLLSFGDAKKESIGERINQIAASAGGVPALARKCGFSDSVVRKWISDQSDPSAGRVQKIAAETGFNAGWIITGEGAPKGSMQGRRLVAADHAVAESAPDHDVLNLLSARIEREEIARAILRVERLVGDAFPDHVRARWAADAVIDKIRELGAATTAPDQEPDPHGR